MSTQTQTWYPQPMAPVRTFEVWSADRFVDFTHDADVAATYAAQGYDVVEY